MIGVKEGSKDSPVFKEILENVATKTVPAWLELTAADATGKVGRYPTREEIDIPIQEHFIVELYSR